MRIPLGLGRQRIKRLEHARSDCLFNLCALIRKLKSPYSVSGKTEGKNSSKEGGKKISLLLLIFMPCTYSKIWLTVCSVRNSCATWNFITLLLIQKLKDNWAKYSGIHVKWSAAVKKKKGSTIFYCCFENNQIYHELL